MWGCVCINWLHLVVMVFFGGGIRVIYVDFELHIVPTPLTLAFPKGGVQLSVIFYKKCQCIIHTINEVKGKNSNSFGKQVIFLLPMHSGGSPPLFSFFN